MTHYCTDLRLGSGNGTSNSIGPSVITLCGATTDLTNGAKIVWEGFDCNDCLSLGVNEIETLRAKLEKIELAELALDIELFEALREET